MEMVVDNKATHSILWTQIPTFSKDFKVSLIKSTWNWKFSKQIFEAVS